MTDRVRIGKVEIVVLLDLTPAPRDPGQSFPDVPAKAWERHREHLDTEGKFQTNFCGFAVRTPDQVLLVDTGLGPGPHANAGGATGTLLQGLGALGLQPGDVDTVINTHLHGDHIGWNVNGEGAGARPYFPRARYVVPKADWDFFTSTEAPEGRAAAVQRSVAPLKEAGVLEMVEGPYVVTPEITTLPTPGHTPGHQCVVVSSQGEKGIMVGDLLHNPVQVEEPDWSVGADMDKEMARASRRTLLDRLEEEGFTVGASHIPFERNLGKVVRVEGRRFWQVL